jgi:hypothetical protein
LNRQTPIAQLISSLFLPCRGKKVYLGEISSREWIARILFGFL